MNKAKLIGWGELHEAKPWGLCKSLSVLGLAECWADQR